MGIFFKNRQISYPKLKKMTKWRKIILGSELSEPNNEPTLRLHQKSSQKSTKKSKIIFGSELSEANNEPTFRLHQKIDKNREKNRKINEKHGCFSPSSGLESGLE